MRNDLEQGMRDMLRDISARPSGRILARGVTPGRGLRWIAFVAVGPEVDAVDASLTELLGPPEVPPEG